MSTSNKQGAISLVKYLAINCTMGVHRFYPGSLNFCHEDKQIFVFTSHFCYFELSLFKMGHFAPFSPLNGDCAVIKNSKSLNFPYKFHLHDKLVSKGTATLGH